MHKKITIRGTSSKTDKKLIVDKRSLNKTLLDYLRLNNLPIASSCSGEGVCKKCIVSEDIISCQVTVREYLETEGTVILISYL